MFLFLNLLVITGLPLTNLEQINEAKYLRIIKPLKTSDGILSIKKIMHGCLLILMKPMESTKKVVPVCIKMVDSKSKILIINLSIRLMSINYIPKKNNFN
jgi:hypothetical protein